VNGSTTTQRCAACAGFIRRPPRTYQPPAAARMRSAATPAESAASPRRVCGVSPRGAVCIAGRFASNPAFPSPSRVCSEGLCGSPATSFFSKDDLSALPLRRSRCQPSNKAGANPRRSTPRTTLMVQLGNSRLGNAIAATWRITKALTM